MNDLSEMIIYTTEDGLTKVDVNFDGDTVWLTINQMAELFQRDKSTISRHIKNVYEEGELQKEATVAYFATVQMEGDRQVEREICYYILDVIISVSRLHKTIRTKNRRELSSRRYRNFEPYYVCADINTYAVGLLLFR